MSILKPTLGQLVDRLALLYVKAGKAEEAGKPAAHFDEERIQVRVELERRGRQGYAKHFAELIQLHADMWPLVERADAGDESVSAVELHRLNRRRAEVREEIDKLYSEFAGPEKV